MQPLRLKKLEIYGFKSFADRVEITFDEGITGVIGPNGSGKSNISDAVRWVLGEQSAKTLRGGKMEDVIFNGTEKRKKLPWCEVILTIENEDRKLPIDFAEVAVSRRVYRTGDSEYMINRNPCRLRDVVELFRDTGIGKEGYSLIGQGRIDEILSAKSEDRRQVFEEAAGIVKYKTRKQEAERRMENTRLNLSRVEDILTELSDRLEPLREQSQTAREYLQLRDELKGLELNAFLLRSDRYNERIEALKQSLESFSESVAQSEAEQARLTDRRDELNDQLSHLEERAAESREEVQRLIREVEAREGAAGVLKERIASGERDRARIEHELSEARQGEGGMQRLLTNLGDRITQETAEAEACREELARLEAALALKNEELAAKEAQAESLKQQVIDAINRLSDVKSEQARLRAMDGAVTERLDALSQSGEDDGALLGERTQDVADAQKLLDEEKARMAELSGRLNEVQQALSAAAAKSAELEQTLRALTAQKQETASRLRVLEEMQRDYEGYQNSVKQVLLQARRTGGSGVLGVVATLISVPRELERAVDMALGGALQNVVVEREEDAKRMIDYLRANRLGRATFLPLSAVSGRTLNDSERRVLSMPGCVGLASELISYDPKYKGVVENLLGRTVIAKDLDTGIAIHRAGRHAFRLVTLEGDVMNPGGSMTGGSVTSRVTSLLSRERELAEHKERLKSLTGRLTACEEERAQHEKTRASLKDERTRLFDEVHQQEIACTREEAHLSSAQAALSEITERAQRTRDEAGQLTAQREEIRAQLAALEARQQDTQTEHTAQQADVVRLNAEIVSMRSALALENKTVNDKRVVQASRERGLTALSADLARITAQKADLTKALSDNESALSACAGAVEADREQLARYEQALTGDRVRLDEARKRFADCDAERTGVQKAIQALSLQMDTLRAALDEIVERRHKTDTQLTRVEGEFKQLTDRIWEDYELSYAGAEEFRVADFRLAESEKRIGAIKGRIREMGAVNVGAVEEFRQTQERFDEMSAQRDDLLKAQMDLTGIIDELVHKMETQFKTQFDLLNQNFQETFVKLFGGGHAHLELADAKDVLNCGIEVVVQPPGKKLQMLSLLSGGERALTAIAILFAMLKLKPTPFCFLDEIEAALDDANIDNFADYLKTYSVNTQFVVVTHRKGTMERCDSLYGIAMEEKGVSKMVSVKLGDVLE